METNTDNYIHASIICPLPLKDFFMKEAESRVIELTQIESDDPENAIFDGAGDFLLDEDWRDEMRENMIQIDPYVIF